MEALGINVGLLVVQIIAFIIVFLTLQAWVYKPMLGMMHSRKEKIAQGLEDARVAAEARAGAEKEAARILAEANAQAGAVMREAGERAAGAAKEAKISAEGELATARKSMLDEAQQERNRILGDLRGQVAALAIAATQKLVGEALDEKRQHALIDEFFTGIKAGKVVVLEDADIKGESAVVTSALPLKSAEQDEVKKSLSAKLGAGSISFAVDPAILGGLVIRVGDRVVDGSVAAQLGALRESLK